MSLQAKMNELMQKKKQIEQIASIVNSKEKNISQRESNLRQGQLSGRGMGRGMGADNPAQDLLTNIQNAVGYPMTPGNIGDINSVIWPYYFRTDLPDSPIAVNETFQTGFSVTQEAAFIMMSFTKTVYQVEGDAPDESWTYLDPDDNNPSAPGLVFTLRDGSSSRQLYNSPIAIDNYGNPRFPTILPRPIMILPNQVTQIAFTNSNPSISYVPFITVFGYRMRVDEAQKILSLVYG